MNGCALALRLDPDRGRRPRCASCSAVEWSITTSFAPGHAPSTSESELNRAWVGSTEKPRCGAPPKLITLPFEPIRFAVSRDAADRRLRRPAGPSPSRSSDSSNGGRSRGRVDADRRLAGDRGVGAAVDVREDRVERVRDRVREHERAAHRRDPEHDRERGQERPELAAPRARGARSTSRPADLLHRRDHLGRLGAGQLLDDVAVGEEEDAVGDRGASAGRA